VTQSLKTHALPTLQKSKSSSDVSKQSKKSNMKVVGLFLALAAVDAFAPAPMGVRPSFHLYNERVDSSDAVKDAMAATEKYGATSPEAAAAWDIVEEMDASDNR
jgi:hypothetical protein